MKYDALLLNRNTRFSLCHVKMQVILAQMDLNDALLEYSHIPSSWLSKEKQCKYRKTLSIIHLYVSNQILRDVFKEIKAIMYDEDLDK